MTPEQEKEWKALSNNLKKYLSKGEIEVIRQFINKVEKEAYNDGYNEGLSEND